ncbi:hypothetical protein OAM56_06740 [Alphaproteobacteria bacterium]|nr:hypothetical protein [Alphaproteobacteria bacterium]
MQNFKLSSRLFSEIFWISILGHTDSKNKQLQELILDLEKLDILRKYADYNTGSISLSDAWCLFSLIDYFKPKRVVEIGTFIGKSTWSMAKSLENQVEQIGNIYTCDMSNDIKIPWKGKVVIKQFPRTESTEMLKKIEEKIDFLLIDGRLNNNDNIELDRLLHSNSIIALDDFEGMEKGVANLFTLKRIDQLKNHFLIYPCKKEYLQQIGLSSHSLTAILLPANIIQLTAQG